jgi:SAM-dependent methyltransferase
MSESNTAWTRTKAGIRALRRRYFPEPLVQLLRRELAGMESVLDVGCGSDSRLQFVPGLPRKVGVDAFGPSIERARAQGIHHEYIQTEIERLDLPERSFDAVIALDVVEHFDKAASLVFVERLERLARKRVILFTPNGFLPQEPLYGNPWQEHKCGWDPSDFSARGYRVEGVLGWKALRGALHLPRLRPHWLGEQLAHATLLYTAKRPHLDAALFAVKDLA